MRKVDWEARLNAYIAGVHDRPHAFGEHDCMIFCANAVRALTGRDLARGHRRKYRDKLSAASHLRSLGFADQEAMIDSLLPQKPVGFAQRGDIVLTEGGIPGVVFDGATAMIVGDGLVRVPRSQWLKAWEV